MLTPRVDSYPASCLFPMSSHLLCLILVGNFMTSVEASTSSNHSLLMMAERFEMILKCEGPKRRTREGGSEWELIKILLEGDRGSNKMNTTSNTCLRLNYPSWSKPRSHWSATNPRNQQTTFRAKTHNHTQRKLARLAACATPVRPMACVGQTVDTGQTGGQNRSGRWLQQPHNKCSREPQ
jgi:hypothetical protein